MLLYGGEGSHDFPRFMIFCALLRFFFFSFLIFFQSDREYNARLIDDKGGKFMILSCFFFLCYGCFFCVLVRMFFLFRIFFTMMADNIMIIVYPHQSPIGYNIVGISGQCGTGYIRGTKTMGLYGNHEKSRDPWRGNRWPATSSSLFCSRDLPVCQLRSVLCPFGILAHAIDQPVLRCYRQSELVSHII